MQQIYETAVKAYTNGLRLKISDYRRSDGSVSDLLVEFLSGELGYREMVREALQDLKEGKLKAPAGIAPTDFAAARQKQIESWSATLAKPLASSSNENSQSIVFGTEGGSPKLTLRHMRVISKKEKVASPKSATIHRNGVTAASAHIREHSSMSHYEGMLTLTPGKFSSVSIP